MCRSDLGPELKEPKMSILEREGLLQSGIQLASAGEWESAIDVSQFTDAELQRWLLEADRDIAIEVLFDEVAGALAGFVGLRHHCDDAKKRAALWMEVVDVTRRVGSCSGRNYVAIWCNHFNKPLFIDDRTPDSFELGVFNQWRSAGSVILPSGRITGENLVSAPRWAQDGATAPICYERVWRSPLNVWVASVVSEFRDGRHFIKGPVSQTS